jgi:hypothetical protein
LARLRALRGDLIDPTIALPAYGRTAMTGKAIDIDQSLAVWSLRSLRLSVYRSRGAG